MNKDIMLGILIGFILAAILVGIGGFFLYPKLSNIFGGSGTNQPAGYNSPSSNCTPVAGETAYIGKISTISPPGHPEYKQYTLQSTNGTTYYLNTANPAQVSDLESKMGKNVTVNGTLVRPSEPGSTDVNVKTICP